MNDPAVYDPEREPFAGGIDQRVIGRQMAPPPQHDPETGEILPREPRSERRPYQPDTARSAWPPRSGGPLPPPERIPPDLNIFTAQDEIDAWAHEHNAATNELEAIRRERADVQIEVMKARMKYRRVARANPAERGRRTADDIKDEVGEALAGDPSYVRLEHLDAELEIQLGRLFRAKDNTARLDAYVRSLPRIDAGGGRW